MSCKTTTLGRAIESYQHKYVLKGSEKVLLCGDNTTPQYAEVTTVRAPAKLLGTYDTYDEADNAAAQEAVNVRTYALLVSGIKGSTARCIIQVLEPGTSDSKVVQYLWAGTNLYYRHITVSSACTQVTATGSWTQYYLYSLGELQKTNQTKTTANTNRTYINALRENIKELGNFESESDALAKLADVSVCGSKELVAAHLTYQNAYSITMIQSIENDYCRQIIFNKCCVYHRAIYFTDGNRTATSLIEDWAFLTADRLAWDSESRKYLLSQFGHQFGAAITDSIPLATSSVDGLMSKALVAKIAELEARIAALEGKSSSGTNVQL